MHSTQHNWLTPWLEMELTAKNIGIDFVINPTLYPTLLAAIRSTNAPIALYDFGAGTSSLGVDLLIRNPRNVPGLAAQPSSDIQAAREKIVVYRGYDIETRLVDHANARFTFYGAQHMHAITHDAAQTVDPITGTNAIAVSRNMLMQLPRSDVRSHLRHTAQLVGPNGCYVFSVLNPEYEQLKHVSPLKEEEQYMFAHGKTGELGSFTHYYRSREALRAYVEAHFHIKKILPCRPLNDRFRDTHTRYYDPLTPMALVYITRAK